MGAVRVTLTGACHSLLNAGDTRLSKVADARVLPGSSLGFPNGGTSNERTPGKVWTGKTWNESGRYSTLEI